MERNPLLRRSDRIESWGRVTALVMCVLALPVAVVVGVVTFEHLAARAEHEAATREQVQATLLDDPVAAPGHALAMVTARVEWTTSAHGRQVGTAVVPPTARRGDLATMWLTADGDRAAAPLSRFDAAALAVLGASLLLLAATALVGALLRVLRWALDRGRYRDWTAAWDRLDTARHR
jgi:hypothetical protein